MQNAVHHLFRNSVQRYGDKEAVTIGSSTASYAALNKSANKIARQLRKLGMRRGDRIGIFLDKSIEAVSSMLGILKADCIYVPLDCNSPASRNAYIAGDCGIEVFITTANKLDAVREIRQVSSYPKTAVLLSPGAIDPEGGPVLIAFSELLRQEDTDLPDSDPDAGDAAAILYTSGTTGRPKGAVITHGNILAFCTWVGEEFRITERDVFISHAPFHFDLSLLDIFSSLANGARVVLVPFQKASNPQFLTALIAKEKITIWQSVPSALVLMAEYGDCRHDDFRQLRCVLFAGERLSLKYLTKLMACFGKAEFYNIYGCTETNDTFLYHVPAENVPDPLPIGKPLPSVDYLIIDGSGAQVPKGSEGELLVSAPTVMKGYWGGREEALGSFVELSGGAAKRMRFYRTKDVVRLLPDGNLHLCGRTDNIIKSNGYRINLLEIEKHLMTLPEISEAAVVPIADEIIGNRICAAVSTDGSSPLSVVDLKVYCSSKMPKYMIPHVFDITDAELPKTSSGKIDKQYQIRKFRDALTACRE